MWSVNAALRSTDLRSGQLRSVHNTSKQLVESYKSKLKADRQVVDSALVNWMLNADWLLVCCVVAVPGDRVDCRGGSDWSVLVLPGGQELQDNGIVQEHGSAVCDCGS